MSQMVIFSLTIVLTIIGFSNANSYCQYTCDGLTFREHVMCLYPNRGHSPQCGRVMQGAISVAEREEIVRLHNKLRQRVANGQEFRGNPGPQPAAKFMPHLVWDDELAEIAQRWTDQCTYDHACSTVDRFQVGQNVGWRTTYNPITDISEVKEAIMDWYNEVELMDSRHVSSFVYSKDTGHYTQIVWAETDRIGCGITKYSKGEEPYMEVLIVCNYGRAGNWRRESIYIPV